MRAVLWMSSVVVASVAVIGASRLWAEDKEKKPALRTRIGLVNLTYIVSNYDKFKQYRDEIATIIRPFRERDVELRSKLEELKKQAEKHPLIQTSDTDRNDAPEDKKLAKQIKEIQREIEDNKAEINEKMSKRSDAEMVVIYKDVMEATQSYATMYDLNDRARISCTVGAGGSRL